MYPESDMIRLASTFVPDANWRHLHRTGRGVNNTTCFLEAEGTPYVLRIYETHRDEHRVQAEHAVLEALAARPKPFRTPRPVRTPDGGTLIRTPEGKLAALFPYMAGDHPPLQDERQLHSFGAAAAALSVALAGIALPVPPAYRPYYEIEHTHPLCPPDSVSAFCASPPAPFDRRKDELRLIGERFTSFLARRSELAALPHQIVHGDLNASNVLADASGAIAAVLDFEFATIDLRVMELAVCLSDLIDPAAEESAMRRRAAAMLEGYGSAARLTADELAVVPVLLALRRLDVFVHFLGRYRDGVDDAEALGRHIGTTAAGLAWLDGRTGLLESLLHTHLTA